MDKKIRVLLIEDQDDDAQLLVAQLIKGNYIPIWKRVDTYEAVVNALKNEEWDLILCDYKLPDFSGIKALSIYRETNLDVPFIFVTGNMGEDVAVEAMKMGAHDWVLKHSLARLIPAIDRELKEAENRLLQRIAVESLRNLSRAIDQSPVSVVITNPKGDIEFINPKFTELTGYTINEVLGQNPRILKSSQTPAKTYTDLWANLTNGKEWRGEFCNKKKNGELYWETASISAVFNSEGVLTHYVAVKEDITEKKRAEKNLAIINERYNLALKAGNFGVWERDVQKNELIWDDTMFELYGLLKTEFAGTFDALLRRIHPEDVERYKMEIQQVLNSRNDYNTEFRIILPNGSIKYIKAFGYVVRDDHSGKPLRLIGINFDISESKLAEIELMESEERYRIFINSMDDMTFLKDDKFKYRIVNSAQANYFTKEPSKIIGQTDLELMSKEAAQHCIDSDRKALTSDTIIVTEEIVGEKIYETHKFKVPLPGNTEGVGGYIIDITKRKRSEQLLNALNKAAIKMATEFTLEGIFKCVSDELKKLDFVCMAFPLNESGSKLYTKYLSYDSKILNTAEKLVGVKHDNFALKIDSFDEFKKVVHDKKTIFVEDIAMFLRKALPGPAKMFSRQLVKILGNPKNIIAPIIIENKVAGVFSVLSNDLTMNDIPAIKAFAMQMASAWYIADLFQNLKNNLEELEQTEKALKQSYTELNNLHNNLDEAIFSVDMIHNKMLQVSIAHKTVFGYSTEAFFNNPQLWYELIIPEDKPIVDAGYPLLMSGKKLQHEFRIVHADKQLRWIEAKINPTLDSNGKLIRIDGIASNITDRKIAEENLKNSREQLKKFAAHLQNIREEERILLAREIHDELGQILTAVKIDIGMLKQKVLKGVETNGTDGTLIKIDHLFNLVDKTIKTTRKIMTELRPEVLDTLGFIEAVKSHASEFKERHQIDCQVESTISRLKLNSQQSVALYRIFQEALTNVARHSMATKVKVHISIKGNKLIMEIIDNGIGLEDDPKIKPDSYGLIGMRERAFLLDGELLFSGKKGEGTSIRIEIPYSK